MFYEVSFLIFILPFALCLSRSLVTFTIFPIKRQTFTSSFSRGVEKIEFQIKATAIERITTKKSDKVPMQKSGFKKERMSFVPASMCVCVPSSWMIETENKKNKLAKVFLSNRASPSLSFSISANLQRDEVQEKSAQAQPNLNERNISKNRNIFMECHESR